MKTVKIPVPRKFQSAIKWDTLEVVEFAFRSKRHANGYIVTMAAIWIPNIQRLVFGASACSPEDAVLIPLRGMQAFRREAARRSMGRARQHAFWVASGFKSRKSLIGPEGSSECMWHMTSSGGVKELATIFAKAVAGNAEAEAARVAVKKLMRKHPSIDLLRLVVDYVEMQHKGKAANE